MSVSITADSPGIGPIDVERWQLELNLFKHRNISSEKRDIIPQTALTLKAHWFSGSLPFRSCEWSPGSRSVG